MVILIGKHEQLLKKSTTKNCDLHKKSLPSHIYITMIMPWYSKLQITKIAAWKIQEKC